MSEKKLLPVLRLSLTISIFINGVLALISFFGFYYLHIDPASPIFNSGISIILLFVFLVIDGLDLLLFASIRRNPSLSYFFNIGFISISFIGIIVLPLSNFYEFPILLSIPLSTILIVDFLNSLSAWRIALKIPQPKRPKRRI